MLGLEYEYLTGVLTSFMRPHAGWSTSVTMLRAFAMAELVVGLLCIQGVTYSARVLALFAHR
jgi:hypothetical protein